MATARRMPTNVDILDALTENMAQEGNTTVIGGNLEIDGSLQVNQPLTVDVGESLTEGYHIHRESASYDHETTYASAKVIIQQKNKDGTIKNQREFSFPPQGGTILGSGNVKTLFGDQSLVGSGNIDLYRHVIKGQALNGGSWGGGAVIFILTVISSKNLKVDSLTDLKTLLGNTFEYPATGYYEGNGTSIWVITQSVASDNDGSNFGLGEFTFTDTVTTV